MNFVRIVANKKFKLQSALLAGLLKQARVARGMTQRHAAAQLGRDQTFIAKIESGAQWVTFVELEQLAYTYQKSVSFFETEKEISRLHPDLVIPEHALVRYPGSFPRGKRKVSSPSQKGRAPGKSGKR